LHMTKIVYNYKATNFHVSTIFKLLKKNEKEIQLTKEVS